RGGQSSFWGVNWWNGKADDMEQLKNFAERNRLPVFTATQGNRLMQSGGTQTKANMQGNIQKSQKYQLVVILTRELVGKEGLTDKMGRRIAEPGDYSPIVNV